MDRLAEYFFSGLKTGGGFNNYIPQFNPARISPAQTVQNIRNTMAMLGPYMPTLSQDSNRAQEIIRRAQERQSGGYIPNMPPMSERESGMTPLGERLNIPPVNNTYHPPIAQKRQSGGYGFHPDQPELDRLAQFAVDPVGQYPTYTLNSSDFVRSPQNNTARQIVNRAIGQGGGSGGSLSDVDYMTKMGGSAGIQPDATAKQIVDKATGKTGGSSGGGGFMQGIGNFLSGMSNAGKQIVDRAKAAVETTGNKPAISTSTSTGTGERTLPRIDTGENYPKYGGESKAGQELAKRMNWEDVRARLRKNEWNDKYKTMTEPENLQKLQEKATLYNEVYGKYRDLGLSHQVADKRAKAAGGEKMPIIPGKPGDENPATAMNIYGSMRTDEKNDMANQKNYYDYQAKNEKTGKEYDARIYDSNAKKYAANTKAEADLMRANMGVNSENKKLLFMAQKQSQDIMAKKTDTYMKAFMDMQKIYREQALMGQKLPKSAMNIINWGPEDLIQNSMKAAAIDVYKYSNAGAEK